MNDLFLTLVEARNLRSSNSTTWRSLRASCTALCISTSLGACATTSSSETPARNRPNAVQGLDDFNFLIGRWTVENRKLIKPLSDREEWQSFPATQNVQALPGGIGNFDDYIAESWRPGFVGMTLRVFNPETHLWSIYWLTNRNGGIDAATGALMPPVVGRFEQGVGVFEGADVYEGKPILMRFTWTPQGENHARWEQAFSPDGGASWQTNWVMRFTRAVG